VFIITYAAERMNATGITYVIGALISILKAMLIAVSYSFSSADIAAVDTRILSAEFKLLVLSVYMFVSA
jgi:hypothetical protein